MFFRSFLVRLTLLMALVVTTCAESHAQDSSTRENDNLFDAYRTAEPKANEKGDSPNADPLASGFEGESRDPTSPPSKLLDRIPRPDPKPEDAPEPKPTEKVKPKSVAKPTHVAKAPAVVPLPALPKITLRGIVVSRQDHGTAMLDVNGESVSISLIPVQQQQRIPIPAIQFASMKTALDQRATLLKKASNNAKALDDLNNVNDAKTYEMSLECSFVADGIVFNLEAFTSNVILLRAIPHDTVVIVRK